MITIIGLNLGNDFLVYLFRFNFGCHTFLGLLTGCILLHESEDVFTAVS